MVTRTLDERLERCRDLRRQGYNCAQTIAMAMDDVAGVDADRLAALTAGLGGGIGGRRSTCGCVTVMAMIAGMARWTVPAEKGLAYAHVSGMVDDFTARHGSDLCAELKARRKGCNDLIFDTVAMLHNSLAKQ